MKHYLFALPTSQTSSTFTWAVGGSKDMRNKEHKKPIKVCDLGFRPKEWPHEHFLYSLYETHCFLTKRWRSTKVWAQSGAHI